MLEVGKYYSGVVEGNSYKCLGIQNNKVTMRVLMEISQQAPFYVKRKDGVSERFQNLGVTFTQDLAYQDQYKLITDEKEISRLSEIFDKKPDESEKNKMPTVPLVKYEITCQQFNSAMEAIDTELQAEKIAIANRSIQATLLIGEKLKVDGFQITGGDPTPEYFTSHNLGAHIHQWYDVKYGDKMKKDFRIGRMVVVIKGELFEVGFPLLFGRANFICDPTLRKYPSMGVNGPVTINLLAIIDGLTSALAAKLTDTELKELATLYGSTYNAMINYVDNSGLPSQKEILTDMETAIDSFFYTHEQFGQSKWHSLQFAEKLLKSIIESYGKTYPFTHKLKELTNIINTISGIKIDDKILSEIECKPEVRYNADLVSAEDAIKAHHAALALLRSVLDQLPNTRKFSGVKTNT